jgi:hypothetical protein
MNGDLTLKYKINGPNNVVRLTDGNKILYIFGDYHYDEHYQNECNYDDNYDSIDIDKLLLKFIKTEKEKEFDFFFETDEHDFKPEINNQRRNKYIFQVGKLFNSKIKMDNNKIIINEKYKNFRFHYFDIRHNIDFFKSIRYNMDSYYNILKFLFNNLYYKTYTFDFNTLLSYNERLITETTQNIEYLQSDENINIKKIRNKYQNVKIKHIINNMFNIHVIKNLKRQITRLTKINLYMNNNIDILTDKTIKEKRKVKILYKIYSITYSCCENLFDAYVVLTDLFFIRRFLDKDYIKNAITYTGLMHMNDIIYILTKYFNYKITNIFYKNNDFKLETIKNLKTKNFKHLSIMGDNLYNRNHYYGYNQCVDLFSFPSNFS